MRRILVLVLLTSCYQAPIEDDIVISTESSTVCECHDSAVSIYRALILEDKLEYKQAFWKLREECFTQFGVLLFYPSSCNDPDHLDALADSLRNLGIDINSP